jgi:hypothetical protein
MAQDPSAESLAAGGSLAAVQAMPVRSHAPAAAAAASSAPPWADVDAATWGLANATVPEKPDDRLPPDVDTAKLSDAEIYRIEQSVRIRTALAATEEAAAADLAAATGAAALGVWRGAAAAAAAAAACPPLLDLDAEVLLPLWAVESLSAHHPPSARRRAQSQA